MAEPERPERLKTKMKSRISLLAAAVVVGLFACGAAGGQEPASTVSGNDSLYTAMLFAHLRSNFDDIHDVSMRFHHLDHRLNGMIQLHTRWEGGRMIFADIARNETKSDDFALALIKSIGQWNIEGLAGPFEIDLPLGIKIVGSDDSTFAEKGILTGEIKDETGVPVSRARLTFRSAANASDTLRSVRSNREGIFVKTLIPLGRWDVEVAARGYETILLQLIEFQEGTHLRRKIVLHAGS
jgi:hypothetical protein